MIPHLEYLHPIPSLPHKTRGSLSPPQGEFSLFNAHIWEDTFRFERDAGCLICSSALSPKYRNFDLTVERRCMAEMTFTIFSVS